ncbi:MAG TPA: cytochrome c oxidase assembly protein [Corynebacterium urealyticum]|nr:cytochrome c oxidase assembly protein [Corynebacterium urealyticum]
MSAPVKNAAAPAQSGSGAQKLGPPILVYIAAALVAGIVGAVISVEFLGESLAALGVPDPGTATTFGLPFLRSAATLIGCMGVGGFLMSAFGAPPRKDGYLDYDGYAAARTGQWGMFLWAVCALLLIPLYMSDVSGSPLKETLKPDLWGVAIQQVSTAKAFLAVAIIAGLTWFFSLLTRKWIWQPVFLALALCTMIPLALDGHSASGGNHDFGVNSLLWHVMATAVWVGGLMALVAHAKRRGPHLALITKRYSFVAFWAFVAVVLSGLVNAAIRVRFSEWLSTDYGLVITAKAVLGIVLLVCGYLHRQSVIPKLEAAEGEGGSSTAEARKAFSRLAIGEIIVMAGAIGVAISLSRIPPPLPQQIEITTMDILLGFRLTEPPNYLHMFGMFRLDLIYGVGAIILQALYMWAWFTLRKKGQDWPINRLLWWTAGNVFLLYATSSGLGMYAMAMFSPHMLQHMILAMVVPICWALGGPMTLFLRALPAAGRDGVPGPREWLVVFINNPISRFWTHPIVAGIQFVVGFYWLYLSTLFDWMGSNHSGHLFMIGHFLISGYIYFWVIIGVDAAPRHISAFNKMLVLFGSVVFHAWFGIALMQMRSPMNADFYQRLDFPFAVDILHDQWVGGAIAWGLGELPLLIVSIAHGVQWYRSEDREAKRYDRHQDRTGGQDLQAYNAMLASMTGEGGDFGEKEYYTADYETESVQSQLHTEKQRRRKQVRRRKGQKFTDLPSPEYGANIPGAYGQAPRSQRAAPEPGVKSDGASPEDAD